MATGGQLPTGFHWGPFTVIAFCQAPNIHRQTDRCYQVHYLPRFAVDNNNCLLLHIQFWMQHSEGSVPDSYIIRVVWKQWRTAISPATQVACAVSFLSDHRNGWCNGIFDIGIALPISRSVLSWKSGIHPCKACTLCSPLVHTEAVINANPTPSNSLCTLFTTIFQGAQCNVRYNIQGQMKLIWPIQSNRKFCEVTFMKISLLPSSKDPFWLSIVSQYIMFMETSGMYRYRVCGLTVVP